MCLTIDSFDLPAIGPWPGLTPNIPVQPLNGIVGPDLDPMLRRKITVGHGFLNPTSCLFAGYSSFIARRSEVDAVVFSLSC